MTDAAEGRQGLDLVAAAASGDADAFARIMALHDADMSRVCMTIVGDVTVAREAVQAAWPIAWRRLGSLRDPDRLRAWLMTIAANEARQITRRERRAEARDRGFAPPEPLPDPGSRAASLDLAAALARLDAEDRRLIGLRYLGGLTSAEIAHEMGASASAIRGRLARILDRLRTELRDD